MAEDNDTDNDAIEPATPTRPSAWRNGAAATAVTLGGLMSSTALAQQQYAPHERPPSHTTHVQREQKRQADKGISLTEPLGTKVMDFVQQNPCTSTAAGLGLLGVGAVVLARRKPEQELNEYADDVQEGADFHERNKRNNAKVNQAQGHDGRGKE